jgi:hypothetical protein
MTGTASDLPPAATGLRARHFLTEPAGATGVREPVGIRIGALRCQREATSD